MLVTPINALIAYAILLLTRNEEYSDYRYIQNEYNWTTSFLSLIFFALFEAVIMADFTVLILVTFASLYISSFTMKFWLTQLW